MRVLVLSDTHLRPGGRRRLPDEVYDELVRADAVLHAGDIMTTDLVHELSGFAPVHAVLGNNDDAALAAMLPETRIDVLGGVRVGMIHDSGPTKGRPARLRRRFPDCELVVYGHSHIPYVGIGLDGQRLFNPGSPTERRAQPHHTYGLLDLADGDIRATAIRVVRLSRTGG
ncbi:MAG: metallophosphatase family protein [Actinomycetota bacterium]|nr:metallophosphatase family protein [Actinomycetota bacterium]